MYDLITWFTDCPYFNFFSSVCGIFGAFAIINFLYFRKPKIKVDSTDVQKIIDKLLQQASQNPNIFVPLSLSDIDDFPDLKGKRINTFHSFYIFFEEHSRDLYFALIETNSDLRLYACLDVLQSSFRLIATNKTNPDLKPLLSYAAKSNDLSDKDYLKEILGKIKDF